MSIRSCLAEVRRIGGRVLDVVTRAELEDMRRAAEAAGAPGGRPISAEHAAKWEELLKSAAAPIDSFQKSLDELRAYRGQLMGSKRATAAILCAVLHILTLASLSMIIDAVRGDAAPSAQAYVMVIGVAVCMVVVISVFRIILLNVRVSSEAIQATMGESMQTMRVMTRLSDNMAMRPIVRYAIALASGNNAIEIMAQDARKGKYTSGIAVDCDELGQVSVDVSAADCAVVPFDPCERRERLPSISQAILGGTLATVGAVKAPRKPYCTSALRDVATELIFIVDRADEWDRPLVWKRITKQMALIADVVSAPRMPKEERAAAAARAIAQVLSGVRAVRAAAAGKPSGGSNTGCQECARAAWSGGDAAVFIEGATCRVLAARPAALVLGGDATLVYAPRASPRAETMVCFLGLRPPDYAAVAQTARQQARQLALPPPDARFANDGSELAAELESMGVDRLAARVASSSKVVRDATLTIGASVYAHDDPLAHIARWWRGAEGGADLAWHCVRLTDAQFSELGRAGVGAVVARSPNLRPKLADAVARFMPLDYAVDVAPHVPPELGLDAEDMAQVFRDAELAMDESPPASADVSSVRRLAACGVRDLSANVRNYMHFFPIQHRSAAAAAVPESVLTIATAMGMMASAFVAMRVHDNPYIFGTDPSLMQSLAMVGMACIACIIIIMLIEMRVKKREMFRRHDVDRKISNGLALDSLSRQLAERVEAGDEVSASKTARSLVAAFNACNAITATQPKPPFPTEALATNVLIIVALVVLAMYVFDKFKPFQRAQDVHALSVNINAHEYDNGAPIQGILGMRNITAGIAIAVMVYYIMRLITTEGTTMEALRSSLENLTTCS
jgi:hypothetical protein